jgi:hypothetical protein
MQLRWRHFLRKLQMPELSFGATLHGIDIFLRPVWNAIVAGNELQLNWSATVLKWNGVWDSVSGM